MDWSKAKTILIIAFVIVNIFILYVIVNGRPVDEPTVSDEFILNTTKLLKDKNITIDTEMPRYIPSLTSMIVEFENANPKGLNDNYFNGEGIIKYEKGVKEIYNNGQSILVINDRLIIYENNKGKSIYQDLSEEKAIKIAEEFIHKGNFNTSDMKLSFIKEENGTYYLEYSKVYEDIIVERAYTNIQINKRGVKRFERLWLNVKELGQAEIYISTAPKSLLTLLGMQEVHGKTITDISLCYYFDPEKHEYLNGIEDTKQGKAIPAWRIQFSDGYKVFIGDY